jgi:GH15 family glucan-1,4-alpha-glucosidase
MIDKKKAESLYRNSVRVLKKVQLRSGGCLATPKGERYPYVYPRDNAVCIMGFVSAGMLKNARKALDFILRTQLPSGAFPQRVDTDGKDASYKPIQIDGTALNVHALSAYVEASGDIEYAREKWETVELAVEYIIKNKHPEKDLVFTPNSVHEFPPMEEGLEIWANAACLAALDKACWLSRELRMERPRWVESSNAIRNGIKNYMWNSRLKSFIKTIRLRESSSVETDADSSCLALCDLGVFPDSDPKMVSTIRRIESNLWNRDLGGLCRYQKYQGRNNGGWGSWPHFTLMLARHYIRMRDRKKSDLLIKWVTGIAWKDELPEHIATSKEFEEYVSDFEQAGILRKDRLVMIKNARKHPMFRKGVAYVTLPLAWPHADFIRTWNLYKEVFVE